MISVLIVSTSSEVLCESLARPFVVRIQKEGIQMKARAKV